MGRRALGIAVSLVLAMLATIALPDDAPSGVAVRLTVVPDRATVGDPIGVTIEVDAPAGVELEPVPVGPEAGPFHVTSGRWSEPVAAEAGLLRWTWSGTVAAFEPGALELPAIPLRLRAADGTAVDAATEPREIHIESVLDAADAAEIADLKPPASLPRDVRPLVIALAVVLGLLAVSAVLWWLHRRYAARLAAAATPEDPFHRIPAHVWVYSELQKLLDRRLAEGHQVPLFFEELARIVKRYLGGRYRIDLMEATTHEVPEYLGQVGTPQEGIRLACLLLERCDLVKFAREEASASACREAIEQAYRIVDLTKPAEAATETVREQGAA
jgi:hypothetical protein